MAVRHVISALLLVVAALVVTSIAASYLSWRASASVRPSDPYRPPAIDSAQGLH